jgi:uncharacterized protein YggT (Ycf19 family)
MKLIAIKVGRVLLLLVYAWLIVTLVLLFLAFILQLFGANPTADFVDWVYRSVEREMAPFRGMFEPLQLSDQSVLDLSLLFAMIVYGFVALGLHAALEWVTGLLLRTERQEEEAEAMTAAAPAAAAPTSGRVVHLTGQAGTTASAVLTTRADITYIDLTATGLDPARTYGVWLQGSDGARSSAGTFQPASAGTVRVALSSAAALGASLMFGVTEMPDAENPAAIDILAARL